MLFPSIWEILKNWIITRIQKNKEFLTLHKSFEDLKSFRRKNIFELIEFVFS